MAGWIVFVRVAVPLDWPEGGHDVRGGGRSATIEISGTAAAAGMRREAHAQEQKHSIP